MRCSTCQKDESQTTFANSVLKRQCGLCQPCRKVYNRGWYAEHKEDACRKARNNRKVSRAKAIFVSTYYSDRRKGREHNLDEATIEEIIADGCIYCLDKSSKMTIDRIDNSGGHIKSNVVASCCRCNWFRRDLPYEVWMLFVPVLRDARERGLLDGWNPATGNGTGRKWANQYSSGVAQVA